MFKSLKRIVCQVEDLEKAKQWYCKILKSPPVFETPNAAVFVAGDCSLSLVKGEPPLPESNNRVETFWSVDDIEASYEELLAAGAKPLAPVRALLNIKMAKVLDPFGNSIGLTAVASNVKESAVENQPSETALNIAICRALAALEERDEIKGPDFMAELFLPEEGKKHLRDAASRTWGMQRGISPSLYAYTIARTAYLDAAYKNALAENMPQIVFLGAGYDTRSYRYPQLIQNTRIFELDIRSTQQRKLKILADAKVKVPQQVSFVAMNFKTDNFEDVLPKAGYNKSLKTLFIWEGVTYYLAEEAINSTLRFVLDCSASGSTICFDYMTEKMESVYAGEPFIFWIAPDHVEAFLFKRGFKMVENLDSTEMEKRFLTLKDGTVAEKVMTRFGLVRAEAGK
jgi:methyltransferase (TIGR00027 family)